MTTRDFTIAGAALAGLLALAGCNPDKIVQVDDPDVLLPGALNTRGALPTIRAGVIGNFQIAFSGGADLQNGGHEGQVNVSGLLSDEYISAETFPDRIGVDQREILPGNGSMKGVFLDLSRVRAFADFARPAALHHEKLDGSGYPWGFAAHELDDDGDGEVTPEEVLAAAKAL
jgi:hypothetical protein